MGQSVLRKVGGLKQQYEQDLDFATGVNSLTALAFVPPEVPEIFEEDWPSLKKKQ